MMHVVKFWFLAFSQKRPLVLLQVLQTCQLVLSDFIFYLLEKKRVAYLLYLRNKISEKGRKNDAMHSQ